MTTWLHRFTALWDESPQEDSASTITWKMYGWMAMGTVPFALNLNTQKMDLKIKTISSKGTITFITRVLTYHPSWPLKNNSPHVLCGTPQRRTHQTYWLQALFQDNINQVMQNFDLQTYVVPTCGFAETQSQFMSGSRRTDLCSFHAGNAPGYLVFCWVSCRRPKWSRLWRKCNPQWRRDRRE